MRFTNGFTKFCNEFFLISQTIICKFATTINNCATASFIVCNLLPMTLRKRPTNSVCEWQVATAQTTDYSTRYLTLGEHSYISTKRDEELSDHTWKFIKYLNSPSGFDCKSTRSTCPRVPNPLVRVGVWPATIIFHTADIQCM